MGWELKLIHRSVRQVWDFYWHKNIVTFFEKRTSKVGHWVIKTGIRKQHICNSLPTFALLAYFTAYLLQAVDTISYLSIPVLGMVWVGFNLVTLFPEIAHWQHQSDVPNAVVSVTLAVSLELVVDCGFDGSSQELHWGGKKKNTPLL